MSSLELRDVVKHYRSGGETVHAVDGVSLRVDGGSFVALYGPSGSGKTTALMLAAGLMRPDSGEVFFDDRSVSAMRSSAGASYRLHDVGFVFQAFHLIPGATALDNAAVKLLADGVSLRAARRRALPWLERVGLGSRCHHSPEQLSMGERQRVAIARALTNEPRLLLADEPTGSLDTQRSQEILALLRGICRERVIPGLLVTHDPEASEFVDAAYVLRDGQLRAASETRAASGTP